MNYVLDPVTTKPTPVRARDAASLILLRGEGRDLELLAGRRPLTVRFMPGVYVFPGGAAYAEAGVVAGFGRLRYVGRAITPVRVFRRFNTRFFLGDGADVIGEPTATDELEDVRWHPIGRQKLEPLRDVSEFMLARAIALRNGEATGPDPLFYTVAGTRRIGVCREGGSR